MGIGILIVIVGSLIYKGRCRIRKTFIEYRNRLSKKEKSNWKVNNL